MIKISKALKEDLKNVEPEKTWTAYYFESMGEGQYHWVGLTNDDDMDFKPDGFVCITQGVGPLKDLLAIFGPKSRDFRGKNISIYVDGVKQ